MRFTSSELAEIRSAFHQRVAVQAAPKKAARRKPKHKRRPATLVRDTGHGDDEILTARVVAEAFGVSRRTITRWAESDRLPSFRTLGAPSLSVGRRELWVNRAGAASP